MKEILYALHGVEIRLVTDSSPIRSAVQELLRSFQPPKTGSAVSLEIRFEEVRDRAGVPPLVSPEAQPLFTRYGKAVGDRLREEWQCTLYQEQGRQVFDFHEQGLLSLDLGAGRAQGYLVQPEAMQPNIRASFFHFALTELLRGQDLYTLHAAALEKDGRALLIPGASGRGKTTCCVSLLRAGYRCLSDDHPLLRENGQGLELLSFPVKIDVTEASVAFFPELQAAGERLHAGARKQYLYVEELFPGGEAERGRPVAILFPRVVDCPESHLEPLPRSRALEELLRQTPPVFDPERASRQFELLGRLVEQTSCYRLHFGEDVMDLPRLIDPLLEEGAAV